MSWVSSAGASRRIGDSGRRGAYLFGRMVLSEKSATFRDHALGYLEGASHDQASPQGISASDRGRCRAAGGRAHRQGASLSVSAGAYHRRLPARRGGRHRGARHSPMALGPFRPAIRHREPAGRRHQRRDRGGGQGSSRRPHAAVRFGVQRDQHDALRQAQLRLHPRHRSGRQHRPLDLRHGRQPIGFGQHGPS